MSGSGRGEEAQSASAAGLLSDHINQNIADIVELQQRDIESTSLAQRRLERVSRLVARPTYILVLLGLVCGWIGFNALEQRLGLHAIDPPPFVWLQGLLTLVALLTATVVLIAQRRQTKVSEERAHLALQINLVTEQKVTKLIHLIEELRRDLPMVRNREDPHAAALEQRTDTAQVVSALKNTGLTQEPGTKERARD
jgi:uncharacterized membrane protein